MAKIINSLETKLTASFILLILIIAGGSFFFTFNETKDALKESVRTELLETISIISSQITNEEINILNTLKSGDEGSENYMKIVNHLVMMRSNSKDITNIYIMKKDGDNIVFLVDDIYPSDPAMIDEIYDSPDPELLKAFNGEITASTEFYTDEWGTFLSGYAPIKNNNGEIVAVIGEDIKVDKVIEKQNFIGNTIYIIIGIGIIFAGLIIFLFSTTIIKDLKKLNQIADKISSGDMNVSQDVKRNDEIGELANSFGRMVASLKIMMMEKEETDKTSDKNIVKKNNK